MQLSSSVFLGRITFKLRRLASKAERQAENFLQAADITSNFNIGFYAGHAFDFKSCFRVSQFN